jgi:carbonic anhydrase
MPEVARDLLFVQENTARRQGLLSSAQQFANREPEFSDLFSYDRRLDKLLPFFAFAQGNSAAAYQAVANEIDLKTGQHPKFAVSSSCDPAGNCIHGVGYVGNNVNAALVLRTPDALIRYQAEQTLDENSGPVLTYAAAALYELARVKGIDAIMHMRTSGSVFMEVLYYAQKYGFDTYLQVLADNKKMQQFVTDPAVREFIEKGAALYETVLLRGIEYYEELLIVNNNDRDRVSATIEQFKRTDWEKAKDMRFIRCMEIQQLHDDREAIIARGFASENVIVVYQEQSTADEYVWNPTLKRFILVPNLDEDSPNFHETRDRFISHLPPRKMWREVAELLLQGARNYRHFAAAKRDQAGGFEQTPNPFVISCSDSRALPRLVIDTGADEMRVVLRNPGAFISREGNLMSDARRFLALADMLGESVIIAPHGNCGAQTAIDAFYEGQEGVPGAFQDLAKHRIDLMRTVLNKGERPEATISIIDLKQRYSKDEIIDHYRKESGIHLASVADCLALQQLLWDVEVIQREFPNLHVAAVFQNMTECQNYLLNRRSGKFVAIPEAQPETPVFSIPAAATATFKS